VYPLHSSVVISASLSIFSSINSSNCALVAFSAVVAFSAFPDGGQVNFSAFVGFGVGIENLVLALFHHPFARYIWKRIACPGIEQAHEIVKLGSGAHRWASIAAHYFFVQWKSPDSGHWFCPRQAIPYRQWTSVHRPKSFPCSGVGLLHKGIKRHRQFATSTDTFKNHQGISGNFQVNVFEILLFGTKYFDVVVAGNVFGLGNVCVIEALSTSKVG